MTEKIKKVMVNISTHGGRLLTLRVSFAKYVLFENWFLVKPPYIKYSYSTNRYPYTYADGKIFKLIGQEGTALFIRRTDISSVQVYFV